MKLIKNSLIAGAAIAVGLGTMGISTASIAGVYHYHTKQVRVINGHRYVYYTNRTVRRPGVNRRVHYSYHHHYWHRG